MAKVNYFHHISRMMQPADSNDCWAAAVAIVMGRHSQDGLTHVKKLAAAGGVQINSNGTLPPASAVALARVVHLFCYDTRATRPGVRSVDIPFLEKVMQKSPAAAFGVFNYPGQPKGDQHAVVLFGLIGDGSPGGTQLHVFDPQDGKVWHWSFEQFFSLGVDFDFVFSKT